MFAKDSYPGEFCESWKAVLKAEKFENVDISSSVAQLMGPKEDSEVITVKKACLVTVDVFTKYLKDQIMEIIDSDKVSLDLLTLQYQMHYCILARQVDIGMSGVVSIVFIYKCSLANCKLLKMG